MKRALLITASLFYAAVAFAGASPWSRVTQSTACQEVSTTAVEVLDVDKTRIRWSIWTTSGAPTIYFREDGTAVAKDASSGPLTGGLSYTEDAAAVTKAVSAITASGTAWVCTKEAVSP